MRFQRRSTQGGDGWVKPLQGGDLQLRYTVESAPFASGSMGTIWSAWDGELGREVAVKCMAPELVANAEARARFRREVEVLARLSHPGICTLYSKYMLHDPPCFTMKRLQGRTLKQHLAEVRRSSRTDSQKLAERMKLIHAFFAACEAVAFAHSRGVIHRDLKPDNIMLGQFGETVVLDWGLARLKSEPEGGTGGPASASSVEEDEPSPAGSTDGTVIGTPLYMPPEQAEGRVDKMDERSDVYSLGAILYEILSGRVPFEDSTPTDVLHRVRKSTPAPLGKIAPWAPPDLVSLAEKAMARERSDRLASAAEIAREIAAFRDGRTLSVYPYSSWEHLRRFIARNRGVVSTAAAALTLLAVLLIVGIHNIQAERDDARRALALAVTERNERQALQLAQKKHRDTLIDVRVGKIEEKRTAVNLLADAQDRNASRELIRELTSLHVDERSRSRSLLQMASEHVKSLSALTAARADLLALAREPVAGESVQLLPEEVLREQEAALLDERLMAIELAALGGDFTVADIVLVSLPSTEPRVQSAATAVAHRRGELAAYRAGRVQMMLQAIRLGKDAEGHEAGLEVVAEYVQEVAAWRDGATVESLLPVADELHAAASADPRLTTRNHRKRLEVRFVCGVLAQSGYPEQAIPKLGNLMLAVNDDNLVIEIGLMLCRQQSALAWRPLVELWKKSGNLSLVWTPIRRQFWRVPLPDDLTKPTTADECFSMAELHFAQRRIDDCFAMLHEALRLDPKHVEAKRRLVILTMNQKNDPSGARTLLLELLQAHPDDGLALAIAANWAGKGLFSLSDETIEEMFKKAIESGVSTDFVHYMRADWLLHPHWDPKDAAAAYDACTEGLKLNPRRSQLFFARANAAWRNYQPEQALLDMSQAILLEPENDVYLGTRAEYSAETGNIGGALLDVSRALELNPLEAKLYVLRARIQLRFEGELSESDYQEALACLDQGINLYREIPDSNRNLKAAFSPQAFKLRSECREKLGDPQGAAADLREYLQLQPQDPDAEQLRKHADELDRRGRE